MKESAKRQREIDRANFRAQKLETKARQEAAQKRIDEAKSNK
jgi:hypothetical protein